MKRHLPALGWGLCAAALLSMIAGAILQEARGGDIDQSLAEQTGLLLGFASFPVLGALIANRQPRNPLGWIFLAVGLCVGVLLMATEYAYLSLPLTLWMIPGAVALAIFKHRLYDIDAIVNWTLVYGVLTAILGLVYLGAIVLLQSLLGFSARWRDHVDLDSLNRELLDVVGETMQPARAVGRTMQPAHVSLWLRTEVER
ncbi:MAG: hypothetical protein ACR2L3_00795 [Actinomycetota bacterium]